MGSSRIIDYSVDGIKDTEIYTSKSAAGYYKDTSAASSGNALPLSFGGNASHRQRRPNRKMEVEDSENDALGAGDTYLVEEFLPEELAETAYERLREEVKWSTMYHRGGEVPRLVAVEGEVLDDGSFPFYRHPADESPPLSAFSPTVRKIRDCVQLVLRHPVNHVLIQHYRSGNDYISEHSDKTIDVVRGSNIVNVSLGAQRVMTLRTKKDRKERRESIPVSQSESSIGFEDPRAQVQGRTTQRIPLPHNSMFVMGPETNKQWLHGIHHDNRPLRLKSEAEQFQGGSRISLTFRQIGTFLNSDETRIWGQGAKGKTLGDAKPVLNGGEESAKLIRAFGEENQRSDFDWETSYGEGFDVLHFTV